ncbi:MAG: hypothetical protein HQ481_08180 [Alphaproteobacteria bacterium]|nr:hypothetical protein [Alphaproteobacteria bacterium]
MIRLLILLGLLWPASTSAEVAVLGLDDETVEAILSHGSWPPEPVRDPSNRVSGDPAAIRLGAALFDDTRLSTDQRFACSSCHRPDYGFAEPKARSEGRTLLTRNTPSLWNVGGQRWFGWDGGNDNLWAQSRRPILAPDEMASDAGHVARLIRQDAGLAACYRAAFGRAAAEVPADDVLVDVAKALATWQETLVSPPTPFDRFRDALAAGELDSAAVYPEAARRGAALFVGRARCAFCHVGPRFSSGEFHDVGMPYFLERGVVDPGRHGGLAALKASQLTRLGPWSDDAGGVTGFATRYVRPRHADFGAFRVPSLRGVAETAPYMHAGSLTTLAEVIEHYNDPPLDRLHTDGERVIRPLGLTDREKADLLAFLRSLSPRQPSPPPPVPCGGG